MTQLYTDYPSLLVALDCIVFGFDGEQLKLLIIKRGFDPYKDQMSLVGGFLQPTESLEDAASRILQKLTGLKGVYMEQMHVYSKPDREPESRIVSVAFFALIDINKYKVSNQSDYTAEWANFNDIPSLILDHNEMVALAKENLRYKAALHPLLFELLPAKFTIPQLQHLYEQLYDTELDSGNFSKKIRSLDILVRLAEKEKTSSKKGAFYYKLNKRKYKAGFKSFLNLVNNPTL